MLLVKVRAQIKNQERDLNTLARSAILADLEKMRLLFNQKENELKIAMRKVEELTDQLDRIKSEKLKCSQSELKLKKLKWELTYKKQRQEKQEQHIKIQRAQIEMGQAKISEMDTKISDLQTRLAKRKKLNLQLTKELEADNKNPTLSHKNKESMESKDVNQIHATSTPIAPDVMKSKINSNETSSNPSNDLIDFKPIRVKLEHLSITQEDKKLPMSTSNATANHIRYIHNLSP